MRSDLHVQRRASGWLIKDPIALRYYHLSDEEYFLLHELDGHQSLDEIRDKFEQEFAPRRVQFVQLQSHLSYLHENNLVVADLPGHSERLIALGRRRRRRQIMAALTNVLAIRFRGVDPERFLGWLYPRVRWTFTIPCLTVGTFLIGAAVLLIAVQFSTLQRRLPDFHEFFSLMNLVTILLVVGATKVLHELAHAVTAQHYGCECHEIGLMLLVFMPCLYCNVSDAWTLPGKWQRIAISAAGMYVELVLAAVCTFIWWFSEPGLLNTLCLNQMFVSSVATLLFNGNPLLRYDGYYILSDLVDEPNLQKESQDVVREKFLRDVLGVEGLIVKVRSSRRVAWLATYAVAAAACRLVFVGLILCFYLKLLEPYRLKLIAQMLGVVVLTGVIVVPAWRNGRHVQDLASTGQVRWLRVLVQMGVLLAVLAAVFFIPFPHRVAARVVLQPKDAASVYVSVAGRLVSTTAAGTVVEPGATLAVLENVELKTELEQVKGQLSEQRVLLENLRRRRFAEPEVELRMPATAERLKDLESQYAQLNADFARLTIKVPIGGTVLPPPQQEAEASSTQLPTWVGTPLEERNLGMYLERGTPLCSIGEPTKMEAWLHVEQNDVEFVAVGQPVVLYVGNSGRILTGKVNEIAAENVETLPRRLARQVETPVRAGSDDSARPASAIYLARVNLDQPVRDLALGTTGKGAISVAPSSLGTRIQRFLQQTFRFEL
jgi:putative peptide zinc metalloprotease protein